MIVFILIRHGTLCILPFLVVLLKYLDLPLTIEN